MTDAFLTPEQAAGHGALRSLLTVDSLAVRDYQEPFRALLGSGLIERLVDETVRDLDRCEARLDASTGGNDWRILRTERFSLSLRTLGRDPVDARPPPGDPALSALSRSALFGVLGAQSLTVDLYRPALPRDEDVFSLDHWLEPLGRRPLVPGQVLVVQANCEVVRFVPDGAEVPLLDLTLEDARRIAWNYHPHTLRAAFASSGSIEASRLEYALDLFRLARDRRVLPRLRDLARTHTHHWLRWKALKTLLQIDLPEGAEALEEAQRDSHPHVRNAARGTLANLRQAAVLPAAGARP